jgi:transcriptional regulator with XRE-family HTH domain
MSMPLLRQIRELLKAARKRARMKQAQAGEVVGLSQQAIQQIEAGALKGVAIATIVGLFEAYGLHVAVTTNDQHGAVIGHVSTEEIPNPQEFSDEMHLVIKTLHDRSGLSAAEVAKRQNVHRSTVTRQLKQAAEIEQRDLNIVFRMVELAHQHSCEYVADLLKVNPEAVRKMFWEIHLKVRGFIDGLSPWQIQVRDWLKDLFPTDADGPTPIKNLRTDLGRKDGMNRARSTPKKKRKR